VNVLVLVSQSVLSSNSYLYL